MSFAYYLKRITALRKCVCCRSILSIDDFDRAFCSSCDLAWQAAKAQSCPECYGAASECSCMPRQLSSAGALTLRKLFFYSPKKENEAQNKLVYYLKHHKSRRASSYVACELSRLIEKELDILGVSPKDVLIVNIPRGRRAVQNYGFDQSKEVCLALERLLGAKYCDAIKRRYGGKEQKKLNAAQRKNNIKKLMSLRKDAEPLIKGKYILLFDDVVTTGASMAVCVSILRKAGAKGILCFCIASDLKKEISGNR